MSRPWPVLVLFVVVAVALTPLTAAAAPPAATVKATAWMSTKTPAPNANVTAFSQIKIDGKFRAGIVVTFTYKFRTGDKTCTGKTDKRGIAWCRVNVGRARLGTRVPVEAAFTLDGTTFQAKTSFTPTQATAGSQATPVPTRAPKTTPVVEPTKAMQP